MSEKEELVTITRHFTVDMEKYAASRKAEANIPDDAEGADEFPWEKYLAMPTVADEILTGENAPAFGIIAP